MLLEVEDLHVHYGKIEALTGHLDRGRRGRDRHADRRERRRQDDDPEDALRAAPGHHRALSGSTARTSPACPGTSACVLGICQAPEGRGIFPGMTVMENLEMGTYARRSGRTTTPTSTGCSTLFPRLAERRTAVGRHAVRWRAADARHRPGADGAAAAAAARRAVDGARAAARSSRSSRSSTEINEQGTTVLLVEQNATQALQRRAPRVRPRDRLGREDRTGGGAARRPLRPRGLPRRRRRPLTPTHRGYLRRSRQGAGSGRDQVPGRAMSLSRSSRRRARTIDFGGRSNQRSISSRPSAGTVAIFGCRAMFIAS